MLEEIDNIQDIRVGLVGLEDPAAVKRLAEGVQSRFMKF